MTGPQSLFARVALGLAGAVASLCLASWPRLRTVSRSQFDRAVFILFAASRLGGFALVFLVLGIRPRGDVPAYYFAQAEMALRHRVPYRDFVSSYAPLHAYLDAGLVSLWHTPLAIMLFAVLAEQLLLPVWMRAGREFLPEGDLRVSALLYLASPVSLQFVMIDGQDNVVIAVLAALALLLLLRSRAVAAGAAMGVSVAAIKFLPLLFAPLFFVAVPSRWRTVLGAGLVCGAAYGGLLLLHAPVWQPLANEGKLWSAGDVPYLVESVFGVTVPPRISDASLLLVLLGVFAITGRASYRAATAERMRAVTFGMAAATLALLALSKKSWPPYLMLGLFPVCLVVRDDSVSELWNRARVAGFALFSVLAVAEHSYWASMFAQFPSAQFHRRLMAGQTDVRMLLGAEVLLVAGYLWLLWEAARRIPFRKVRRSSAGRDSAVDSLSRTGYS